MVIGRPKLYRGMYLTDKILSVYPNGFCGVIITGPRGIGKSSLALNVGWEVFTNLGYDQEEAWNKVLEICKFKMEDVINFIKDNVYKEDKAHMLIWDDAGVYASTMEWWMNRALLKQLKSVTDTIRTGVCSILITSPNESGLSKILRDYDDYIVQIGFSKDGSRYRIAKGYLKRTLPSGTLRIYPKFKNKFVVMLPDWFFKKYMTLRNDLLKEQLDKMETFLKEQAQAEAMEKIRKYQKAKSIRKVVVELNEELRQIDKLKEDGII